MCEYCLQWYHSKCEKVSGGLLNEIDSYHCSYCKEWDQRYIKNFKPFLETGQSDDHAFP